MTPTTLEVLALAEADGIDLPENTLDKTFAAANHTTAFTQRDCMQGKPNKLEDFNGFMMKEEKSQRLPTPIYSMTYELLLPLENQARKDL